MVRVTAECCLQEKAWNPYYALLLAKLCEASKSHKVTLQVGTVGGGVQGPRQPVQRRGWPCSHHSAQRRSWRALQCPRMHGHRVQRPPSPLSTPPPTHPSCPHALPLPAPISHPLPVSAPAPAPAPAASRRPQYCLWDHLKGVEGLEVRRLTNLARLLAAVIAGGGLPSTALKVRLGAPGLWENVCVV